MRLVNLHIYLITIISTHFSRNENKIYVIQRWARLLPTSNHFAKRTKLKGRYFQKTGANKLKYDATHF